MKKTLVSAALATVFLTFGANAADQGQGVVNFKGSVIDAPCGIAPESADQSIDFGQISKAHLTAKGISVKKDLDIKLVNCDITGADAKKTVNVTFSGTTVPSHSDELGTAGNTGTAIVVSSADGKLVQFDGTTGGGSLTLKNGDNTLHYSSWVKQATGSTLQEGAFSAVANFNLIYQ